MPFDPTFPAPNVLIQSAAFREQFTSLKTLIDAIGSITAAQVDGVTTLPSTDPAAVTVSVVGSELRFTFGIPKGEMGPQGPPFANAVVESVSTLNPGDPASAGVTFDGTNVRFSFAIPRGNDGGGPQGPQGLPGPPFAQAVVDGVTTLDPGQSATVQTSFDGNNVRFTFGIPRGTDGINGNDGAPGEVSNADLTSAINGTSANTNAVGTLDTGFADPDLETVRLKLNELILAGRR